MTNDQEKIGKIYESLEFDRTGSPESEMSRDFNRRKEDSMTSVEKNIGGVINYYKHLRDGKYGDMEPLEDLEKLSQKLQQELAQFSQWTYEEKD
jgi:hypothetical protein|tara:strand:- start:1759 stop:2040 length:282 start_codon:yes stop_codon:yes gene_type:complete